MCDALGVVVMRNAAAAELAPQIVPGRVPASGPAAALLDGQGAEGESREHEHGGRRLLVRRESFGVAHRAWYLRDVSAESARTDALLAERGRTAFLLEAGHRLSASLNLRRCARTAVELAVPFLADTAMVVLPPAGRRQADWLAPERRRPAPAGGRHRPERRRAGAGADRGAGRVPAGAQPLAGPRSGAPGWVLPQGFGPRPGI
ncbi:hypothetical protein GCM10017559_80830 [Streptosporangium longisporum]|uniref:Uncharacterized protein n=1 Tax=Streptosporangium longisporum TaxID=46187 RepID=A0ABP6LDI2_9ACTN